MIECFYFSYLCIMWIKWKMKHWLLSVTIKGSHGNASKQSSHKHTRVSHKVPVTFLHDFKQTWNFMIDLMKQTSTKFHENPTSGFWVDLCGRMDRRTDLTKLMFAFRNFASKPTKGSNSQLLILLPLNILKTQRILLHGENNFANLVGESTGELVYWWGLRLSLVWVSFGVVFSIFRQVTYFSTFMLISTLIIRGFRSLVGLVGSLRFW